MEWIQIRYIFVPKFKPTNMKAIQILTLLAAFVFAAATIQANTSVKVTDQVKVEKIVKADNSYHFDGDEKKAKTKKSSTKKGSSCTTKKSCCKGETKTNGTCCNKSKTKTSSCCKHHTPRFRPPWPTTVPWSASATSRPRGDGPSRTSSGCSWPPGSGMKRSM